MRQRHIEILSQLQKRERVSVSELATLLGASEVTIRADLADLDEQGLLRRVRGGATRPLLPGNETPLEESSKHHATAKRRIGQAAAGLISNNDTIFLDVGSTTTEIARHLPLTLSGVTIVTNGLNIALELERLPNVRVVVTGGTLRRLQHSLVSPYGLELLSRFRPDKFFLGCNGVDAVQGVTNSNHEEAEIKTQMVAYARATYVVADHSKIGQVAAAAIAPLRDVHTLITDTRANAAHLQALRHTGLNIMSV
ncbi:DeoR/GlpR family DNA-binding transcription regulator [Deinococcus maricopensis]|uniref:Transcriptional regulator, DeoR family n=1 Tax=Deinococcus maricopensis (strain DSM 21211 / LMG 22137 / NRRL B-23946 / LB-34) TaxID=709986 RepID=E8U4T9_DEIML|nr:DeoR/GlpR family DNA-binding transcription regulator [Deinococcus maricopensis]ADV66078.1 transcriptional regulator, DeoR family [Deinococcus maricopensis DSM 21211]